jgi:hypothetical protein
MKTTKLWGFFRKAWLCPCLISLLSSCAALQKPEQEQPRYRVTLSIAPGINEPEITAALANLPVIGIDLNTNNFAAVGIPAPGERKVIQLTLPGDHTVRQLQQQLQTAGITVTGYHIQKLD